MSNTPSASSQPMGNQMPEPPADPTARSRIIRSLPAIAIAVIIAILLVALLG